MLQCTQHTIVHETEINSLKGLGVLNTTTFNYLVANRFIHTAIDMQ